MLGHDSWEVLRLTDGDEVVGAVELLTGSGSCFVARVAQLLRFGATPSGPGPPGGGMPGSTWARG